MMCLSTILNNNLLFKTPANLRELVLLFVKVVYAPVGIKVSTDITVR